ncbi:MAG: transposase [Spirochaetaceae bacterium]|jgi:transposase-like protein|nr:transposase [Spirochaetaceae bacterium]
MSEVVRYSEAFKLRLAGDVASGKYASLDESKRRNGIRGSSTLRKWIKKYGREMSGILQGPPEAGRGGATQ